MVIPHQRSLAATRHFSAKKNMFWLWIKALQRQMPLKLATLLLSQFSLSDFNFQIICFVFSVLWLKKPVQPGWMTPAVKVADLTFSQVTIHGINFMATTPLAASWVSNDFVVGRKKLLSP